MKLEIYSPAVNPLIPRQDYDWNPWGCEIDAAVARTWLETIGQFDYGKMTAYLLRAYGLPNMRAYDVHKHSHRWGLRTPEGYLLSIEPRLVQIDDYASAPEPGGARPNKQDAINHLAAHGVFSIEPLSADAPPLTPQMLRSWFKQFMRPIYVRDVGANILGPLSRQDPAMDVGPGHSSVLDAGAQSADEPVSPSRPRPG